MPLFKKVAAYWHDFKLGIRGVSLLKNILAENNDTVIVFVAQPGIGDICISCSYLRSYIVEQKKLGKKCTIVGLNKREDLFRAFGITSFKGIDNDQLDKIRYAERNKQISKRFIDRKVKDGKLRIMDAGRSVNGNMVHIPGLYANNVELVMGLQCMPNAGHSITYPDVIEAYSFNSVESRRPFIILNPYSNSMVLPLEFFSNVVNRCNQIGMDIYCNVCGNQKEIPGTKRLEVSIEELYYLSAFAECVISIRSGILDYIVSRCKKIVVIYNNYENYPFYSLKMWNSSAEIHELNYSSNDAEKCLEGVLNVL